MDLPGIIVLLALCGIVALEAWRGGGKALFDAVALVIAAKLAGALAAKFAVGAGNNEALGMALLFILLGGGLLVGAKLLADTTLWSFDPFDSVMGGVFGVVAGGAAIHVILRVLLLAGHGTPLADYITASDVAYQFVTFQAFHDAVHWLRNLSGKEYEVT